MDRPKILMLHNIILTDCVCVFLNMNWVVGEEDGPRST